MKNVSDDELKICTNIFCPKREFCFNQQFLYKEWTVKVKKCGLKLSFEDFLKTKKELNEDNSFLSGLLDYLKDD